MKRKIMAVMILAVAVVFLSTPALAQELDDIQKRVRKGRVIQASQVFTSIASTTNREILVQTVKDCVMVGKLMLSAVGQTNGPTIIVFENVSVTNAGTTNYTTASNGTMLKVINLSRGARNSYGVYAWSEPSMKAGAFGTTNSGYGVTNAKYILAQTENGVIPDLFPAPIEIQGGVDYLIRITNSGAATTDISLVLQFGD